MRIFSYIFAGLIGVGIGIWIGAFIQKVKDVTEKKKCIEVIDRTRKLIKETKS